MSDVFSELERFKSNSKLFSLMDEAGIHRLANIATSVSFTPAAQVISEGELGTSFYLIVTGGVRVAVESLDGPKEVARLGPGAFFGEMAVLNNEPRTASVVAIGDLRCLEFEKAAVLEVLTDYPRVREILGVVGLRRAEHLLDVQLKD